jgi:hypothetical protein
MDESWIKPGLGLLCRVMYIASCPPLEGLKLHWGAWCCQVNVTSKALRG